MPHDRHTLVYVIRAVAANLCPVAFRIFGFGNDIELAGGIVIIRLNIGKAVDARNNLRRVLAKAVEDNLQVLLAYLVRRLGDTDCAFRRRKGFVPREEAEASCFFLEQHRREVAVPKADKALFRNRAGDAERLQTNADCFRRFRSFPAALLECDGRAQRVRPDCVFKSDGLDAAHDAVHVDSLVHRILFHFLEGTKTVFLHALFNLGNSSFITFKCNHVNRPPYSLRGSMYLTASSYLPYVPMFFS
ncbi:MAG: hypothetical protein DELT_03255 [Desulfovibrio sp.]